MGYLTNWYLLVDWDIYTQLVGIRPLWQRNFWSIETMMGCSEIIMLMIDGVDMNEWLVPTNDNDDNSNLYIHIQKQNKKSKGGRLLEEIHNVPVWFVASGAALRDDMLVRD